LYFTAAAIRDSKGNVIGAVETLEDVTEHRLAEDTIQKAEERCRRILEAVSPSNHEKLDSHEFTRVAL
jgi:PAS domain-containing protein